MRPPFISAVLLAASSIVVSLTGGLAAQSEVQLFVIRTGLQVFSGADGGRIMVASGAPLLDTAGNVVGTGTATSVVNHPTAYYFPTVGELQIGAVNETVVVTDLISRPPDAAGNVPARPFRRATAHLPRTGASYPAAVLVSADDPRFMAFRIRPLNSSPTNLVVNFSFGFIDARRDAVYGNTNTAVRNRAEARIVPAAGVQTGFGQNFNFAAANAAQSFTMNFLREAADDHSGAVVACVGSRRPCYADGTGIYDGFYGVANALTPASLGVNADAASNVEITRLAFLPPGYGGCPVGLRPPAPADLIGSRNLVLGSLPAVGTVAWSSVTCASEYVVRFFLQNGTTIDLDPFSGTQRTIQVFDLPPGVSFADVEGFAVASIDASGAQGVFSDRRPIPGSAQP